MAALALHLHAAVAGNCRTHRAAQALGAGSGVAAGAQAARLALESRVSPLIGSRVLACPRCIAEVSAGIPARPVPGSALEAWQAAHSTGLAVLSTLA